MGSEPQSLGAGQGTPGGASNPPPSPIGREGTNHLAGSCPVCSPGVCSPVHGVDFGQVAPQCTPRPHLDPAHRVKASGDLEWGKGGVSSGKHSRESQMLPPLPRRGPHPSSLASPGSAWNRHMLSLRPVGREKEEEAHSGLLGSPDFPRCCSAAFLPHQEGLPPPRPNRPLAHVGGICAQRDATRATSWILKMHFPTSLRPRTLLQPHSSQLLTRI